MLGADPGWHLVTYVQLSWDYGTMQGEGRGSWTLEEMGLGFWGIWVFPEQAARMGSACEEGLSRD